MRYASFFFFQPWEGGNSIILEKEALVTSPWRHWYKPCAHCARVPWWPQWVEKHELCLESAGKIQCLFVEHTHTHTHTHTDNLTNLAWSIWQITTVSWQDWRVHWQTQYKISDRMLYKRTHLTLLSRYCVKTVPTIYFLILWWISCTIWCPLLCAQENQYLISSKYFCFMYVFMYGDTTEETFPNSKFQCFPEQHALNSVTLFPIQ